MFNYKDYVLSRTGRSERLKYLNNSDIYQLAKNAFQAGFLDQGEKQNLLNELSHFVSKF
jgi:adenosine deaminase